MVARFIRFSSKNRYLLELSFNKFKWLNMTKKEGRKNSQSLVGSCRAVYGTDWYCTRSHSCQVGPNMTKMWPRLPKFPRRPNEWTRSYVTVKLTKWVGGWYCQWQPIQHSNPLGPLTTYTHNERQPEVLWGILVGWGWALYVTADIVEERVSEV